ncbi:NAD(P)-dependent oxidoreductase [Actinocrispum sp. NPDC049592]|uniref:NAD(P)-dependent oxidoreductase n=1 Tax=Actinocrispum sp. NPDC049592 TaxID=3154835 RepID=UPI003436CA68
MVAAGIGTVGFVGVGVMGEPMALNLLKAGTPLLVWNRSASPRVDTLTAAGAVVAPDADTVFAQCDVVILMLANKDAIDATLGRGTPAFAARVSGRTVVHMGTTAPGFSAGLAADILAAGGAYVEAPVSGSRVPAEAGELVAMLAGEPTSVALVRPVVEPMCRELVDCGPVPNALLTKIAVNICLITTITGLAETMHFAAQHGLDLDKVTHVLATGQMSSPIMRVKLPKWLASDFTAQAAIGDVWMNTRLITGAAREASVAVPLLDVCEALFAETDALGHTGLDMAAVIKSIEARTATLQS